VQGDAPRSHGTFTFSGVVENYVHIMVHVRDFLWLYGQHGLWVFSPEQRLGTTWTGKYEERRPSADPLTVAQQYKTGFTSLAASHWMAACTFLTICGCSTPLKDVCVRRQSWCGQSCRRIFSTQTGSQRHPREAAWGWLLWGGGCTSLEAAWAVSVCLNAPLLSCAACCSRCSIQPDPTLFLRYP